MGFLQSFDDYIFKKFFFFSTCKWDLAFWFHSLLYVGFFSEKLFYWRKFSSCLFTEVFAPARPIYINNKSYAFAYANPILLFSFCRVFFRSRTLSVLKVFRLIFVDRLAGTAVYTGRGKHMRAIFKLKAKRFLRTKRTEGGIQTTMQRIFQRKKGQKTKILWKIRIFFSHNIKWIINVTIENVNGRAFSTVHGIIFTTCVVCIYYFLLWSYSVCTWIFINILWGKICKCFFFAMWFEHRCMHIAYRSISCKRFIFLACMVHMHVNNAQETKLNIISYMQWIELAETLISTTPKKIGCHV